MIDVDLKKIAQILVENQLRIKENEVVKIIGGLHNTDFIEEIAVNVRKAGAFPMVDILWGSMAKRMINEIPDKYLETPPKHLADIESLIDCSISVSPFGNDKPFDDISTEKQLIKAKANRIINDASVNKGARRIGIGYPTEVQANIYNIPFETYHDLFWKAVMSDINKIFDMCSKVKNIINGGDKVRIISPGGDVLNFSIKDRRINMDDGVISDEDLKSGDITANLPFGEVYLAPIEDTVEGTAVFPTVFHKGEKIKNLKLTFEKGYLIDSSAETNHELFIEAMKSHTGDKNRIGEFGIGTNHEVLEPIGDNLLDEKIFGSIHLALGENRNYGGKNNSSMHWDMIMLSPTVYIDDKVLLEKGKYSIDN